MGGCAWRWPVPLALAELLLRRVASRPLPDKNELANACYFTYRVGYIICDSGLSPEEAQHEMQEGRCNEDFRLMAADFQRRIVRHYSAGEAPPLEEAMWLLTSPENFQQRTLKECPAMQVMAYLILGEARLHLYGPNPHGPAAELIARALEQAQQVPAEVYAALAKAWPMELALQRYQQTAYRLREHVQAQAKAPEAFKAHAVFCHCTQSLEWFSKLAYAASVGDAITVFSYNTCAEGLNTDGPALDAAGFQAVRMLSAPTEAIGARGECSVRGVLTHVLHATLAETPAFTLFFSSSQPSESERMLLEMVLRSLAQRTLTVGFAPLGLQRGGPQAPTACDVAVWRHTLGLGLPFGYEGARFIVSASQVQEQPRDHFHHLLGLLDAPPHACREESKVADVDTVSEAFSAAWHVVFGRNPWLPLRADDVDMPVFLRFADTPSGFQGTKMPKKSTYLASMS